MKITDDMLTGWFPPDTKPIHRGVYPTEIRWGSLIKKGFSYWNGKYWSHGESTPQEAERLSRQAAIGIQGKYWRGLKEPQRD